MIMLGVRSSWYKFRPREKELELERQRGASHFVCPNKFQVETNRSSLSVTELISLVAKSIWIRHGISPGQSFGRPAFLQRKLDF